MISMGHPVKPLMSSSQTSRSTQAFRSSRGHLARLRQQFQLASLRTDKCDFSEARAAYESALRLARRAGDHRGVMEALAGLLRLSGEAQDSRTIEQGENELSRFMAQHPRQIPAAAWYCKGVLARYSGEFLQSQRYFHRYLKAILKDPKSISYVRDISVEEGVARAWFNLAAVAAQRNLTRRAMLICRTLLARYESREFRSLNGVIYLLIGDLVEREKAYPEAMAWFQKAHSVFLAEHNWYLHLNLLLRYARLARLERNYLQSYWYLDVIERATGAAEFGVLRRETAAERSRLQDDAVDLLIDRRNATIRTREQEEISLGKQYVLISILEALSRAHSKGGQDSERGLSKGEIIEAVWSERYRPEAHDNKLYYNINRLRKLIEPDFRKPQYLLNWKEGYRLAPGLRVELVGGPSFAAESLDQELVGSSFKKVKSNERGRTI